MDGLNSFYNTEAGLDRLVNNESTAMIVDAPIHSFMDYHCKVIQHNTYTYSQDQILQDHIDFFHDFCPEDYLKIVKFMFSKKSTKNMKYSLLI